MRAARGTIIRRKERNEMRKIFTNKPEPVIYFRLQKGAIMYIGETWDLKQGRPFRKGDAECEIYKSDKKLKELINKKRLNATYLENFEKMEKNRDDRYIGEYDRIIIVKASKNSKRRQYWEAYFIVKYKPAAMAHINRYVKILKGRNYKLSEQEKEKILNGRKAHLDTFSRKNQESIIKKLMSRQLMGIQMYTDARKCLESVKKNEME